MHVLLKVIHGSLAGTARTSDSKLLLSVLFTVTIIIIPLLRKGQFEVHQKVLLISKINILNYFIIIMVCCLL